MSLLVVTLGACAASPPVVSTKVSSACAPGGAEGPEGAMFKVAQAQQTMTEAARMASYCPAAKTTVTGKAMVLFSPAGCVQEVRTTLPEGSLTAKAVNCVADAFLAARVDAFQGLPVSVAKAFTITP